MRGKEGGGRVRPFGAVFPLSFSFVELSTCFSFRPPSRP